MTIRNQLLCIIVPVAPGHANGLPQAVENDRPALDRLFGNLGCVHFASLAVLPPCADDPGEECSRSLLLEMAIDPGLSPGGLLRALVSADSAVLWRIYKPCSDSLLPHDGLETEAQWLLRLLRKYCRRAGAGYVGLQDRTVRQVRNEAALFDHVRTIGQAAPQRLRTDRRRLAAYIVRTVRAQGRLPGAAPRGPWRSRRLTPARRVVLVALRLVVPAVLIVLSILGALVYVGFLAALSWITVVGQEAMLNSGLIFDVAGRPAIVPAIVRLLPFLPLLPLLAITTIGILFQSHVLLASTSVIVMGGASLAVAGLWGLGTALSYSDLVAVSGTLIAWGGGVCLGLVLLCTLVLLLFLAALATVPAFLGLAGVGAAFITLVAASGWLTHLLLMAVVDEVGRARPMTLSALHAPPVPGGLPAVDAFVLVVMGMVGLAALLLIAWGRFVVRLGKALRKQDRPRLYSVEAAQQIDPSVGACETELSGTTSHMLSVTDVRQGRPWTLPVLRLWMHLVTVLGYTWFTEGQLGNVSGIKFAQWHLINGGRRLLFCSNYDGSFGGYLDGFIRGASQGVNLFWRWTELRPRKAALSGQACLERHRRFPPTRWLVFAGCMYEQWFKAYTRDSMVPHLYLFQAYPGLTSQDIDRATRLRDALAVRRGPVDDDRILRAVDS